MYFLAGTPSSPASGEGILQFWTGGASRVFIGNSGNIGFGSSTNPTNSFEFLGNKSSPGQFQQLLRNTNGSGDTRFTMQNDGTKQLGFQLTGSGYGSGIDNTAFIFTQNGVAGMGFLTDGDIATGGSGKIYFQAGGYSATKNLELNTDGTAKFNSLGTGALYSNGGTLTNTNPSDRRLKKIIKPLTYGLKEILQLNPVSFYYKTDTANRLKQFGFIAQDVKRIMPDAVKPITPGSEYLGLEKEAIYVSLVNAIKEMQQEIEDLKKQVKKSK